MADLRTKINELPICEDVDLIDTLIAIGTDGKTYRVNKDSAGIGQGTEIIPIAGTFYNNDGVSIIKISDSTLIDEMVNNGGGTVHVLISLNNLNLLDIEINLTNIQVVMEQSLSLEQSNINFPDTIIGYNYNNLTDDEILITELHAISTTGPLDVDNTSSNYNYRLHIYKVSLSHIQEVEEFVKTDDGTGNNPSSYYDSYRDIIYANYNTDPIYYKFILNICLENKPIYGKASLIKLEDC